MRKRQRREVSRRRYVLFRDGVPYYNVQTCSRNPEPGDRQEVVEWLAEELHLPVALVDAGLVELTEGGDRKCRVQ